VGGKAEIEGLNATIYGTRISTQLGGKIEIGDIGAAAFGWLRWNEKTGRKDNQKKGAKGQTGV